MKGRSDEEKVKSQEVEEGNVAPGKKTRTPTSGPQVPGTWVPGSHATPLVSGYPVSSGPRGFLPVKS